MLKTDILKGKRILITSWSYATFGGAALNAVELAEQLVKFGMKPTFFSYDIEGPLRDYIEEKFDTKVLTDQVNDLAESDNEEDMGNTKIDINNFDYIWVGGNTLPISVINQINEAKLLPKFIFIHMSSLVAYPLDAPLFPDLEKKIASKILSISPTTTTDCIERIMGKGTPVDYWKNPVPDEFKYVGSPNGKLCKIAVISSSHPSDEIMNIKEILGKKGIEVDYVGRFNNNTKRINADFYGKYDLIIGIGKDARYALVSGIPIYVYGRFGGCGYLDEDNLKTAEAHNLSGRGFSKKDSKTISNEIISGYESALCFHQRNKSRFVEELTISNATSRLFLSLEELENRTATFSEEYVKWLISNQINIMQRMKISHARRHWSRRATELTSDTVLQRKEIQTLRLTIKKLQEENRYLNKNTSEVYRSVSWKITRPLRELNKVLRDILNKVE